MIDNLENRDVTEIAATWVARLTSGELSPNELMELRDWATANPAHLRELERLADIWEGLDSLSALQNVIAKPESKYRRSTRYLAIAAGLTAIALLGVLFTATPDTPRPHVLTETYVTSVGEQRAIETGEGSKISLNTDSELAVDFSTSERRVRMTRGEAFFDVTAQDDRPFIVQTSHGNVAVTGTAFSVRVESSGLEVLVKEGHVKVHQTAVAAVDSVTQVTALKAGEVASFSSDGGRIEEIDLDVMVRKLGWRDGMLMFDGETLEEVIDEVGRYTPTQIVIDDPMLRDRQIGGYFRVGEMEDLLATLQSDFDIRVERINEREVRLFAVLD